MNIKDAYIHNGDAILKDIKLNGSKLQKLKAGKNADDTYLIWDDVVDLSPFGASGHNHDDRYLKLTGGTMSNTNMVTNLNADLLDGYHKNDILRETYAPTSVISLNDVIANGIDFTSWAYAQSANVNNQPWGDGASSAACVVSFGTAYPFQIYSDYINTSYLYYRSYYAGTGKWQAWRQFAFLDSNVSSASKWATPRTITLTGSVTGSVSIDGSTNVSLDTTTNHTHTFDSLTSKPNTIGGYGIVDSIRLLDLSDYVAARSNYGENMTGSKYLEWWNSAGWVHHKAGKFSVAGGTSSQFLKADGSLDSTAYLPLSGGTLSGSGAELLKLDSSHSSYNAILFKVGGVTKSEFGFTVGKCSYIYDYTSSKYLGVDVSGTPFYGAINGTGKYTLIHSGNFNSYSPKLDGTGATGTWSISITGNAGTSGRTKFLETFYQNSTTNTYGSQYPIWAQWSDATNVRLKCTNYTVWTDKATYASNADLLDGYHAGVTNGSVGIFVPWPNGTTLKNEGLMPSEYGTSEFGHPDDVYLQSICKWAIAHYTSLGDVTLIGAIAPNSSGTCILHLYSSSGKDSSTLLPRYCSGTYTSLLGYIYNFGTVNYTWYYRQVYAGYASSAGSATTSTYASNVGSSGTAGTNYVTAANVISMYNWYNSITATDEASNTAIDKWNEIVSFLAGITDTSTLSGILAGYAAAGHDHDGRYIKWGGSAADTNAMAWGTLTTANGYKILSHASSSDGGDWGMVNQSGKIYMQLDGYYYQNEGQYRVTDVSETVTALGTNGNYLTWTKNGTTNNITVPYATKAGNADTLDNIDSTGFLRQVVVPNNAENDFNTFSNMTLTGRVDPTTGALLKNAPWTDRGPAGGYGVLTYLFDKHSASYGTQIAVGYNSNRIYIRSRYWGDSGVVWGTTWDSLALTSEVTNLLAKYLPLTGGTVTGPIEISTGALHGYYREGLRITRAKNNWAGITFGSTGLSGAPTNGWFAALNPSDQFIISPNDSSTNGLTLNAGGDVKWRNNTIWHAGNDGSGSGLDADLLDGKHATNFLAWSSMQNIGSSSPFQDAVNFFNNLDNLNNGGKLVYNHNGAEYTELFTRRNDSTAHGTILKWGYADKYIRIIRMISGKAQSTDWEKISAGYADTAGSVTWDNVTGKPINFKAYSGSLTSGGWKIMQGNNSSPSIAISYNNEATNWNSGTYSATLVYGCEDTRGLIDCAYSTPKVTFGGCSFGSSTDDNPTWYFKLAGTTGTEYNLNSMPYAESAGSVERATFGDGSNGTHDANAMTSNGLYYYYSNGPTTNAHNFETNDGSMYVQAYNSSWVSQIAQDYRSGKLAVRSRNDGTWQPWRRIAFADSDYVISADRMYYEPEHRKFTRTASGYSWDTQAYSVCGYKECRITYKISQTGAYIMVGLNSDPTTDASYQSIDYCWYTQNGGSLCIYENGTNISSISGHTTYAVGDELIVEYSCGQVRYYHNGVLCRAVARTYGSPLYFDCSFYNAGSIENVVFEPIHDSLDFVQTTASYSLSNASWINTITLPTTAGSYILNIVSGNSTLTGVFSIGASDNAKDEISLHLHGNGPRLYARTNGTTLQLSSNDASATSRSVTIKYRRMI